MTGAELIAVERERQVSEEDWTPEHDDTHASGELADAAVVYASPRVLYVRDDHTFGLGVTFRDIWPQGWDVFKANYAGRTDRHGLDRDKVREINEAKPARRIRELTKAGALLAAEIDRLQRYIDEWEEGDEAT